MEGYSRMARAPQTRLCVWFGGVFTLFIGFSLSSIAPFDTIWAQEPRARRESGSRQNRNSREREQLYVDDVDQEISNPDVRSEDSGIVDDRAEGYNDNPNPIDLMANASEAEAQDELPEHTHPKHPLVPALRMAYASRKTLSGVRNYTAVFVKKELLGNQYVSHTINLKLREQPFSVYMLFQAPHEGRQVLFSPSANGGQILVKETGFKSLAGTIRLNPTDPLALSENRHPITQIGISNMLKGVIDQWENETRYGEVEVKYFPEAKLGGHPVRVIQSSHPQRRRQFRHHMTRLFLDKQSLFPVRVENYDWPQQGDKPLPVEIYMYSSVQANKNFTNSDFDPRRYGL